MVTTKAKKKNKKQKKNHNKENNDHNEFKISICAVILNIITTTEKSQESGSLYRSEFFFSVLTLFNVNQAQSHPSNANSYFSNLGTRSFDSFY